MNDQEIKIVKQAILNEIEGYEFYCMAAEKAKSEDVKASFYALADEEKKHVEWLRDLYDKIKSSTEDDFKLMAAENPPSPKIFKWDKLDRKNASLAVSVFGIGMQMEEASVKFSKKLLKTLNFLKQKNYLKF